MKPKIGNVRIWNYGNYYIVTYEPVIPGKYIIENKAFDYRYQAYDWLRTQDVVEDK